jgi:hypothetical protein
VTDESAGQEAMKRLCFPI